MKFNRCIVFLLAVCFALCGISCTAAPSGKQPVRKRLELRGYETLGKDNVEFVDRPFYTDRNDEVTYAFNAMWDLFGDATGGKVAKYSHDSAWLYWNTAKWAWRADATRDSVKSVTRNYPQRADGYLWSWQNSETWGGAGYNNTDKSYTPVYHYDQMFNYINAVREICVWDGSTAFLETKDTTKAKTTVEVNDIVYTYDDASKGKTVWQKTELAMAYILDELGGRDGLIVLGGDNTGDFHSASSNYWDNYSFGHKDPYEGMLFLGALGSMVDLCEMRGDDEKKEYYAALLDTAREKYDETYWDETKGRYISDVTASGKTLDYGLTFLNTEALYYGAGAQNRADEIFSWIDGTRIVAGDTAQGAQILDEWVIAPMTNTVPIESVKEMNAETKRNQTWWHAPSAINVFTNAKYLQHCENGGAIFYTTYFELMSRLKYGGTDDAMQRMIAIAREYGVDELLRDPMNDWGSAWVLGVIGEFPESGLVPGVFVKGFMGVNATARGLEILPSLPEEYTVAGTRGVYYAGKTLDIEVEKDKRITLTATDAETCEFTLVFDDFAEKQTYEVRVGDETVAVQQLSDGKFAARVCIRGKQTVTVQ